MNMEHRNMKISAFTVLELTVVLALLSTIITIISVSLNRFNEQLKNSSDIHQELNEWFAFRANLWQELYMADSIVYHQNELAIYRQGSQTAYRAEDDLLERRTGIEWASTGIAIENITQETSEAGNTVIFNFHWKEEIMPMSYLEVPGVKEIIDRHFEKTDE